MNQDPSSQPERVSGFQLVILLLSFYVLGALLAEMFCQLTPQVVTLLDTLDTLVCMVFLADFFIRLYRAEHRWAFMKWGWLDLISSLPSVSWLRWGRLGRIVRVLRLFRGMRSFQVVLRQVFHNRVQGTLATAALVMATLVIFSSIAILSLETGKDAKIRSASDALWWSFMTITTAGSSDKYPVSPEGRIIGVLLATAGAGLIGVFTGFIASLLLSPGKRAESGNVAEELRLLREQIARLENRLARG